MEVAAIVVAMAEVVAGEAVAIVAADGVAFTVMSSLAVVDFGGGGARSVYRSRSVDDRSEDVEEANIFL